MYYWICLRADDTAGLFQVDHHIVNGDDFQYLKDECGIHYAEVVTFTYDNTKFTMLVDDEGKLKGMPYNDFASLLYNAQFRESIVFDAIVGDVAIVGHNFRDELGFIDSKEDAERLFAFIKDKIDRYNEMK